ncbi:MAG: molybdopterin cofactor-binding domain-containing protein, partial [Anaerolineaceae bacterium]
MSDKTEIAFIVNGKPVRVDAKPGEMLSDLLRERLNLTGTKIGCNEAECGACTVLVDNEPVLSCTYPAQKVNGHHVLTIEGLAGVNGAGGKLHPLQEAFVLYGAVQCGFCIPGQIMTSYALLQENPDAGSKEIRHALKDTLCRCAGYPTIEEAILAAGRSMRTGLPVEPPQVDESVQPHRVVGRIQARPDAEEKVTGKAIYTDDLKMEGMLHGRAKRAMVPHGILKRVDVEKARALPGVAAVLVAEDIPGEHNHGLVIPDWPTMIGINERVRYVGDAVAIVAAETREIASQAVDLIEVEIEPHPVISNAVMARQPDVESLHDQGNLLKHIKVRKGDVEQGFTEADIVLEHVYHTVSTDHAFIEPECSLSRLTEDGRLEIYVGSQIPYADRSQVAKALGWPEDRVRIIGMLIGGGFGGKEDITGQIHAALLTCATGRPVKILYDRQESLLVHPKRHATQI